MQPPNGIPAVIKWTVYIIQQVGFPIAVAIYLLYRMDGLLLALTTAFHSQEAALLTQQTALEALLRTIQ
jgi:hypothetical protein